MAHDFVDVDMSPPATPTRALPSPSPAPTPPTRNMVSSQGDKSKDIRAPSAMEGKNLTPHNKLMKATEDAFEESRHVALKRESIAKEFSRALDEVTSRLQDANILEEAENLCRAFTQVLQRYARGEKNLVLADVQVEQATAYNQVKGKAREGPSYAQVMNSQPTKHHSLPQKPQVSIAHPPAARKQDNRIFIRLPEDHPSRTHHVFAIKSALTGKLDLEEGPIKSVQKVKTGLAIVPTSEKQAEKIMEKADIVNSVLGGRLEKAEEWLTYVVDHVPRRMHTLDGSCIEISPEAAREEARLATGQTPVRTAWTRKSIENPAPTGSIVISFTKKVRPFRLFGTSSLSHQIVKTQKPSQCTKCWGYHDARLCNYEIRCKQCSSKGHSTCQEPPRCANCHGPHSAEERYCPARPSVRGGRMIHLTQPELKRVRQAGQRAWTLVNPNTLATSATENSTGLSSC